MGGELIEPKVVLRARLGKWVGIQRAPEASHRTNLARMPQPLLLDITDPASPSFHLCVICSVVLGRIFWLGECGEEGVLPFLTSLMRTDTMKGSPKTRVCVLSNQKFQLLSIIKARLPLLPNPTWVCSLACSEANLLTPGHGEGK